MLYKNDVGLVLSAMNNYGFRTRNEIYSTALENANAYCWDGRIAPLTATKMRGRITFSLVRSVLQKLRDKDFIRSKERRGFMLKQDFEAFPFDECYDALGAVDHFADEDGKNCKEFVFFTTSSARLYAFVEDWVKPGIAGVAFLLAVILFFWVLTKLF